MGPAESVKLEENDKAWYVHFWEEVFFSPVVQFSVYLLKTVTLLNQFSLVTGKFLWTSMFFTIIITFLADNVG